MAARLWLLAAVLSASLLNTCDCAKCDRTHDGRRISDKTPSDGRFKLEIFDDPSSYSPNTAYTVSLKAQPSAAHYKFIGFLLVAESEGEDGPVGTFQITDFLTKYSEKCPNAVTNTNFQQKTEIQSLWTAPPSGSGCITLKATVIVHYDIWHMDDPNLVRTLCENQQDTSDMEASIVDPCCACDEAKYEVTFEGLWSRHTHPKDFPSNGWLTRFSDVIGASHAADYRFWEYGQHASEGLRQLAEHGATKVLESELKAESDHIRTIIKARGISYPNLTGKTFAVFRVDNRHHLMSLVSMIDPSPDWIVGVSGLELCLKNCSWIESKVIKLYPWDAGTDSGPSYTSPDQPTTPRDVIRKIGTNYPNDPRSPFFDPSGKEMKPLARLILSRQRLYEKSCDGASSGSNSDPCSVSGWGPWSPCSVTCGKGKRYRHRTYRTPAEADMSNCGVRLAQRESCWGPRRHCRVPSEYEPDPAMYVGPCALTQWSTWSSCSSKCGRGYKARTRRFQIRGAHKRCYLAGSRLPELEQTLKCYGRSRDCLEETPISEEEDEKCPVSQWSEWSPCSATCGEGKQIRSRLKFDANKKKKQVRFRKDPAELAVRGLDEEEIENNDAGEEEDVEEEEPDLAKESLDDFCENIELVQEVKCRGTEPDCEIREVDSTRICSQPKLIGPCRGHLYRWFFDSNLKRCEPFGYGGCRGNRNNFLTLRECQRVCRSYKGDLERIEKLLSEGVDNEEENFLMRPLLYGNNTLKQVTMQNDGVLFDSTTVIDSDSQTKCRPAISGEITGTGITGDGSLSGIDKDPCRTDYPTEDTDNEEVIGQGPVGKVIDCRMSGWSKWSECEPSCGKGFKKKTREIIQHAFNGGKKCGPIRKVKECKKNKPCKDKNQERDSYYEPPEESNETDPTWGPGDTMEDTKLDCVLSEWSSWSPCAVTCGTGAFKQRTRSILRQPSLGGEPCQERVQNKNCDLMPCPQY